MSQYNTSQLGKKDIELYHDICNGNGVIAQLTHLTERQIGLLISMRNIIAPYTEIQTRTRFWKVL